MLHTTGMDNNTQQAPNTDGEILGTKVSYAVLLVLHLVAIVYLKQLICKIKESQLIFAHNPAYASFESRFESFENSRNMVYQFICALSEAGFYYSGNGVHDGVTCFSCNTHLKNWEFFDSPWVQHARWSKTCNYLLLCKGKDFVDRIHRIMEADGDINDQTYLRQYYRLDNSDDEGSLSDIPEFNENVDEDLHHLHNDGE